MKTLGHLGIGSLLAILNTGCASQFLYYPTHTTYQLPTAVGCRYESVSFPSKDGTQLSGWFVPAIGKAKGTVLQFHGNAQNMSAHFSFVSWLPQEGFNVFVFDYRGYGDSKGSPDRKGVYEDSCAALNYLRKRDDIDPSRIVILGQSLGGANAIAAIHDTGTNGIRAVAIDSTFYSYRLMARNVIKKIPILSLLRWPLSFLVISNAKSPGSLIEDIQGVPLLVFHGTADQVVPYRQGQLLFKQANQPKELVTIPNGQHIDALQRAKADYRNHLVQFYEKALDVGLPEAPHGATTNAR